MASDQPRSVISQLKLAAIFFTLLILIVFIALNHQSVEVDFLVAELSTPLAVALLLMAGLGFLLGYFAPNRRR